MIRVTFPDKHHLEGPDANTILIDFLRLNHPWYPVDLPESLERAKQLFTERASLWNYIDLDVRDTAADLLHRAQQAGMIHVDWGIDGMET